MNASQQTFAPSDGRSGAEGPRIADLCGWYTGDRTAGKNNILSILPRFNGRDADVDEQCGEGASDDEN